MFNREVRAGATSSSPPSNFLKKACHFFNTSPPVAMPSSSSKSLKRSSSTSFVPQYMRLDSTGQMCEPDTLPEHRTASSVKSLLLGSTFISPRDSLYSQSSTSKLSPTFSANYLTSPPNGMLSNPSKRMMNGSPKDKAIPWLCFSPASSTAAASITKTTVVPQTGTMHTASPTFSTATTSAQVLKNLFNSSPIMTSSQSTVPHVESSPQKRKENPASPMTSTTYVTVSSPMISSSPKKDTEKMENTAEPSSPGPDRCRFFMRMHMASSPDTSPSSTPQKSDTSAMSKVDFEVEFSAQPSSPQMQNRRKKTRPSAKKRRRHRRKCNPSIPTPNTAETPASSDSQKRSKTIHTDTDTDTDCWSPTKFHMNSPKSFQVTFMDLSQSPHSSPDAKMSKFESSDCAASQNPCSKLSFVIRTSNVESESDTSDSKDEDDDDEDEGWDDGESAEGECDLWESFSNHGLGNPLFSFTCNITPSLSSNSSSSSKEKSDSQKQAPPAEDLTPEQEAAAANARWNKMYGKVVAETAKPTKVHFPTASKDLQHVHRMRTWAYAYQAARSGPWEQYARDTERFKKRISDVNSSIGHIFKDKHRTKVYNQHFAVNSKAEASN